MKMKAAVYYGPGDVRIEEIDRPVPGDEGMVMKVGACGICPIIDLAHYRMSFPLKDVPSHRETVPLSATSGVVLGHEFSGEVVEVGPKVTTVKPGDRLYGVAWSPCGKCESCRLGNQADCLYIDAAGRVINGAMAEYILFPNVTYPSVREDKIIGLPRDLSFRDGALLEPLRLSMGLAAKAKAGETVVVFGQEVIGLGVAARLKAMGAAKVIVTDVSKKRLQVARDVGADVVVDALNEDILEAVMDETSGRGADIVMETSCRPESLQDAVNVIRPFGVIWLGTFYTAGPFFDPSYQRPGMVSMNITQKAGISIRCAWGTLGPWLPNLELARDLMQAGTLTAATVVSHVFPLEKAKEAFEAALNPHESIKVMIEP